MIDRACILRACVFWGVAAVLGLCDKDHASPPPPPDVIIDSKYFEAPAPLQGASALVAVIHSPGSAARFMTCGASIIGAQFLDPGSAYEPAFTGFAVLAAARYARTFRAAASAGAAAAAGGSGNGAASPRSLVIGLGAATVPNLLRREGIATDVMELNPVVVQLASEHFRFDDCRTGEGSSGSAEGGSGSADGDGADGATVAACPLGKTLLGDAHSLVRARTLPTATSAAEQQLQQQQQLYNLIVTDLYVGTDPEHDVNGGDDVTDVSTSLLHALKQDWLVATGGVLVVNTVGFATAAAEAAVAAAVNGASAEPPTAQAPLPLRVLGALQETFAHVRAFREEPHAWDEGSAGNIAFFASDVPLEFSVPHRHDAPGAAAARLRASTPGVTEEGTSAWVEAHFEDWELFKGVAMRAAGPLCGRAFRCSSSSGGGGSGGGGGEAEGRLAADRAAAAAVSADMWKHARQLVQPRTWSQLGLWVPPAGGGATPEEAMAAVRSRVWDDAATGAMLRAAGRATLDVISVPTAGMSAATGTVQPRSLRVPLSALLWEAEEASAAAARQLHAQKKRQAAGQQAKSSADSPGQQGKKRAVATAAAAAVHAVLTRAVGHSLSDLRVQRAQPAAVEVTGTAAGVEAAAAASVGPFAFGRSRDSVLAAPLSADTAWLKLLMCALRSKGIKWQRDDGSACPEADVVADATALYYADEGHSSTLK